MGTAELRKEVHSYIDKADETFLKMVSAMSKEYGLPEISGYHADGTPIANKELKNTVKEASDRVKSGQYIRQEDIEKEVSDW